MTTENIFSAIVTFSLMAGATVAFGADLIQPRQAAGAKDIVTLPTATVIGKRISANDQVTLPTVTVTGRRAAPIEVAAATRSVEQRVQ
jgi:hypothetical protein